MTITISILAVAVLILAFVSIRLKHTLNAERDSLTAMKIATAFFKEFKVAFHKCNAHFYRNIDFVSGEKFFSVYLSDGDSHAEIRRFYYNENDENDEIYAGNCAEELCEMLNADYRITEKTTEDA